MEEKNLSKKYLGKCPGCKQELDKRYAHLVISEKGQKRYWHQDCFEKKKIEEEQKMAEQKARQALYNFLTQLGFKPNHAYWGKQRNKFINDYGYTDSGILIALDYWFNKKKGSIEKANGGMGIVPYIYDEAQKYYRNIILKKQKLSLEAERQNKEQQLIIQVGSSKKENKKNLIDLCSIKGDE
jgi:hypothetical protein